MTPVERARATIDAMWQETHARHGLNPENVPEETRYSMVPRMAEAIRHAVEEEREACAQVAANIPSDTGTGQAGLIAAAIRARGLTPPAPGE
jgi:hypothetical protein